METTTTTTVAISTDHRNIRVQNNKGETEAQKYINRYTLTYFNLESVSTNVVVVLQMAFFCEHYNNI